MLVIPAIDLKDGQCVRLKQGRMEDDTVFSNEPIVMAERWIKAGARRLHIIDLNGAFAGKPVNAKVIHQIAKTYPQIPIQVGGGIRSQETIETYLDVGVNYVIIGTKAVQSPQFVTDMCKKFPGHIIVGLDARDGKVATDGWSSVSEYNTIDLAQRFEQAGVEAIIFTDISRDGMLQGLNIDSTVKLAQSIKIPIIAAGGVTTIDDIKALCHVADKGIMGAITGRAIYEGTLDFTEAQKLADG
ncbi:MAG: 1-(5-phosphoribosyl)-5-((5-phosphoribosylamino)methylideneamino)imidazole-4-carboxamide isomerase [Gammaproteobacteria bacterium]|nr:MAG: 1-(5-phosphoribosyl)-5-((5-phosphoribosylamino)methylideneamino)imidazole-4-carboxamide isomerase [Gammaproteobacteria bacterium]RKZ41869.1 MAG: 1-(5-phosphoribosyl)-5-((5-phosphoribosylamino)methylideneamino)imidazole-4-carboxamide isomerase [Gammaproteobacteria bacterium]RKZ75188.1 MAG: 1-(5-phosphoribosyl)-5-((5-phosphoribosylamino)methylideneamino)imidazole-4-carboxamide isomerase [Gammaproteobacteria bacterium]